jgi:hypothetical protein
MINFRVPLVVLVAVVLTTATLSFSAEEPSGGFGIGPGMVLIENVVPGAEDLNVTEKAGVHFEVFNGTAEKQTFTLSVLKPREAIGKWEMGYEEIPDPTWCRLDKNEVEVAAKSQEKINMFVKIPAKPEYFNRKFMVVVVASPGKAKHGVVGLRVASRVQLETIATVEGDGTKTAQIGLLPSICNLAAPPPGITMKASVKVRNNTDKEHTYTLARIGEVEADKAKHERYYGNGFIAVNDPSWIKPSTATFALKPGEVKDLELTVAISKDAERGKKYEELVFLKDESGHIDFIRVRVEIAAKITAEKKDEKAP